MPSFSCIINRKDLSAHFIECFKRSWKVLDDSKVTIKGFNTIGNFIVSISIEYLTQFRWENLSSFVNVEIELKSMEVSGCNNNFYLPVFEKFVIVFVTECNSLEESHIWHMDTLVNQKFVEVNEFYFHDFNWLSTFGPFEIDKEHTMSQFCNC